MATLTDDDLRALLGEAAASFDAAEDAPEAVLHEARELPERRAPRRSVQVSAAAAAAVVAALVATSLQGSPSGSREVAPAAQPVANAAAPESDRGTTGSAGRAAAPATEQLAAPQPARRSAALSDQATYAGSELATGPAAPTAPVPPGVAAPAPDGARVVKNGAIALIVDDGQVTPVLTRVQALASAAGGVVATATSQESGPTPSGSVTLRVPVARFEEVVTAVRGLDAEVRSATTSGQDVTAQYADLEAQLRTLRAARERFLDILSRARSIGDVLAVQQRVDDVTGRIDRLEGARRVLASQSEQATLEVAVTEADDPAVTKAQKPDDGLSKAFADAWDGFTGGVEALVRASGVAVLLALCLAVAYVVVRLAWRASRRRLV